MEPQTQSIQKAWGDQGDGTFGNPVIWADFNNPWLMQVGSDFYLTAASHHFMGMPVLHSRDLVNWQLVGRVYERLDHDPVYDHPGQAYQRGSWAPALVHHAGQFWMYCMNSTDGLFLSTAPGAAGPWTPVELIHKAFHWEDPYPFWDEDGQAYLIHSGFGGKAPLVVHRMRPDGRKLLDDGFVLPETYPNAHNPLLLKRDGYYYLFGTTAGTQKVFRSRSIYGPYEQRVLLLSKGVSSSPGGAGWVELPDECWFMHHVGMPGHGRLPYLQPAGWKDGWPWMGANVNPEGAGEIAWRWPKPHTGINGPAALPAGSDDFDSPALGWQWRWNHNPRPASWSLAERPGWLRLKAGLLETAAGEDGVHLPIPYQPDSLVFAANTLVQLPVGRCCQGTTRLDVSGMAAGQRAGLSLFNQDYLWIGAVQDENNLRRVRVCTNSTRVDGPELRQDGLWLRAFAEDGAGRVAYSLDGVDFMPLGVPIPLQIQWFEAHKFALFSYNVQSQAGQADFAGFWLDILE